MPNFRGNPNAGSLLFEAIRDGTIQKFIVRERKIGHFEVDDGKHLFIVPARSREAGWSAILDQPILQRLVKLEDPVHNQRDLFEHSHFRCYFWIACRDECCELWPQDWQRIIDLSDRETTQSIYLKRPPNCSFRVRGSNGDLPYTIPRCRFPSLAVPANSSR
jgi:hypothetical protein